MSSNPPLGYHNVCDVDRLNKQLADAQALESLLREEVARVHDLHAKALHETELQKVRADHWRDLCEWAYAASSKALMTPATKPREAREAIANALCDINKKLGGAIR